MGKKKKFIDKKNSVTFRLEHRSQKDPEQANEEAPQRILRPIEKKKRLQEQQKYGIFLEDDYDYMQHLRSREEGLEWPEEMTRVTIEAAPTSLPSRFNLPPEVFASKEENEVGLLNLAAPVSGLCLDLDPDIVASLDDAQVDQDPEDMLDDMFVLMANEAPMEEVERRRREQLGTSMEDIEEEQGGELEDEEEEDSQDGGSCSGDLGSDLMSDEEMGLPRGVPSTQFTMSCRSVRTKPHEQLLDEWSDNFVAKHYADDEDDDDEEEGMSWDNPALQQAVLADQREFSRVEDCLEELNNKEEVIIRIPEEGGEEKVPVVIKEYLTYDVKSQPRPKVIHKPQDLGKIIFRRDGLPQLPGKKKHKQQEPRERKDTDMDLDSFKADRPSSYRPKDETPEERQRRKKAIKEDQAMRRQLKKSAQKEGRGLRHQAVEGASRGVATMRLK